MLIAFKLRNFRSFSDEQEFSFATSSDRTHESTHCIRTGVKAVPRLSKAAVLFGPNASGKSNFVMALGTLRDLVLHSTALSEVQYAERYTPFQFGSTRQEPIEFDIDLLLEDIRYRYSISFDSQRICSERLLVYRTGKAQRWFERRYDAAIRSEEWAPFSPNFNGPREMWRRATRPKALLLTTAAQLNSEQLRPLFHWFENCMEIVSPSDTADFGRMAASIQDVSFKKQVLDLLHAVDIQAEDVRVADQDPTQGPRRSQIEFLYTHHGWSVWMEPEYEAAGTQRLFTLLGPFLGTITHNKLLVIDEFDANLHPLVSRFLIQLINTPTISAQLLLISHNATLMDLDILRRDEIWLMERGRQGESKLSPVLRSSPRKHEMIAKGYLRGRYGAVPTLSKIAS
jgi:uncharacterized protein